VNAIHQKPAVPKGEESKKLQSALDEVTKKLEALETKLESATRTPRYYHPQSSRRRPPSTSEVRTCWLCGEVGHLRRQCPLNEKRPVRPVGGWPRPDISHRQTEVSNIPPSINSIYCVNGLVNNVPTKLLIDSGAAMSVIHYKIVNTNVITEQGGFAVSANGSQLDVVGQTVVTVTLDNFAVDHNFTVVKNLTVDCLLGADFLKRILDCGRSTLMVGRETQVVIPLTLNHQPALSNISETSNIVVRVKCDLSIPPRSVQLITGMLDTPNVTSSTMLLSL